MLNSPKRMYYINQYITWYTMCIQNMNANSLYDSAHFFELFAQEVCQIRFKQKFRNLNKLHRNYPDVDLVSEDEQIYIQVSTDKDIPSKIRKTLRNISKKTNGKRPDIHKLFFFVLYNESVEKVHDYIGEKQIGKIEFEKSEHLISTKSIVDRAANDLQFQKDLYEVLRNDLIPTKYRDDWYSWFLNDGASDKHNSPASLRKAERLSLLQINAWKEAHKGLLFDPNDPQPIQRSLIIGNADNRDEIDCTEQNLTDLLRDHKGICVSGDGGCGKTFLLHQFFELLQSSQQHVAIYVQLEEIAFKEYPHSQRFGADDNGFSFNPILRYVQQQINDKDGKLHDELRNENRDFTVVFLLDGLNEVQCKQSLAINAINDLSAISDNLNIILTTRYLPYDLSHTFISAGIRELTDEEILRYLDISSFTIDTDSILRLPLYLRLFKLAIKNNKTENQYLPLDLKTKYGILYYVFGNALSERFRAAYVYLLPIICFRMANENTLKVSHVTLIDDIDIFAVSSSWATSDKAKLELCFGDDCIVSVNDLGMKDYNLLIQSITNQIFPKEKSSKGGYAKQYKICHQDIRDFFAAQYVKNGLGLLSCADIKNLGGFWEKTFEQFNSDTFDVDIVPMLCQLLQQDQLVFPYNNVQDQPGLCKSMLQLFYFLSSKTIESVHNGSDDKPKICKLFRADLDKAYDFVIKNKKTYYDDVTKKILVLDIEVHRRLKEYDIARSKAQQLLELAETLNDEGLRQDAKNSVAKEMLYLGQDIARASETSVSDEAKKLYRDALDLLEENKKFHLSANVLAMLLANPDPVSEKYLRMLKGADMAERRLSAYNIAAGAYAVSHQEYTLLSLLSYILHGYVKVIGITDDGDPIVAKTDSDQPWDIRENENVILQIAIKYIQLLSKESVYYMVFCFNGLIQMRSDSDFDKAMDNLERSFKITAADNPVEKSYLGCFVYAVVNKKQSKEERKILLEKLWITLKNKMSDHSVDNFDASFILKDIITAWHGIRTRALARLDQDFINDIDCELQSLESKSLEEYKKWNLME